MEAGRKGTALACELDGIIRCVHRFAMMKDLVINIIVLTMLFDIYNIVSSSAGPPPPGTIQ